MIMSINKFMCMCVTLALMLTSISHIQAACIPLGGSVSWGNCCDTNAHADNGMCVCNVGYMVYNNECVICPPGQVKTPSGGCALGCQNDSDCQKKLGSDYVCFTGQYGNFCEECMPGISC